ncbi:DNA binding domain-containing protein, excisionase family [Micromonospora carbonacea]|uniref:DNA binding domain-containing protein, excisionase family n=1 Tax=Micromonospora carbonacea TaxID=47853 RepID=A0A1C5AXG7_9ACTN|nr:DNA binding domain-containing protein, excisionase family [Micromonospora carbonacea]
MEPVLSLVPSPRSVTGDAAPSGRLVRAADSRAVYTVAEVAGLLSLSLGSTYALVREGEIPARKLGGRWVIPKNRFHAWLNATDTEGCA